MPPSVEISCFTILIDRQSGRNGLYRRGGAFARIRLDFYVMLNVRERESGKTRIEDRGSRIEDRGSRIEDRGSRIEEAKLRSSILYLRSSILDPRTPHHPHTRFTSVRNPTPVGPTAR